MVAPGGRASGLGKCGTPSAGAATVPAGAATVSPGAATVCCTGGTGVGGASGSAIAGAANSSAEQPPATATKAFAAISNVTDAPSLGSLPIGSREVVPFRRVIRYRCDYLHRLEDA